MSTEIVNEKDGGELILIPEGEWYCYGEDSDGYRLVHSPGKVEFIDSYYIGKYPVTNAQYMRFVEETGHTPPRFWKNPKYNASNQPVVGVSLFDAKEYCRWAKLRLPTEAEWEIAASGRELQRGFPWGDEFDERKCNTPQGGPFRPNPVDAYPEGVSPYGCYDMIGNALEFIGDKKPYGLCVKGGCFAFGDLGGRVGLTWILASWAPSPSVGYPHVGFRVAKDATSKKFEQLFPAIARALEDEFWREELRDKVRPPAPLEDIEATETALGFRFPQSYVQFLRWSNGLEGGFFNIKRVEYIVEHYFETILGRYATCAEGKTGPLNSFVPFADHQTIDELLGFDWALPTLRDEYQVWHWDDTGYYGMVGYTFPEAITALLFGSFREPDEKYCEAYKAAEQERWEEALTNLKQCAEGSRVKARIAPVFDSLRETPEFQALVGTTTESTTQGPVVPGNDKDVQFADTKIEAQVRRRIVKSDGPILRSDLDELTELDLLGEAISDLSGIEHCISLKKLTFGGNNTNDISPLRRLTDLQDLDLRSNQISDISSLRELTNLKGLNLGGNYTSDISPLRGLTKLQRLGLEGNQITDISSLSNLIELQELSCHDNQINDITPLHRLGNLRKLDLHGNQIRDISPLSQLTNLENLDLRNNQMSDISPLVSNSGIGEGDRIDLRENPLNDEAYDHIIALKEKRVEVLFDPQLFTTRAATSGRQFADPSLEAVIRQKIEKPDGPLLKSDLEGLTELHAGYGGGCNIAYLSGIEHCINLQDLDLGDNEICDISSLSRLPNLKWLRLTRNQISNISPLSCLTNLESLSLPGNQISDISPLSNLTNLQKLLLTSNPISDISSLSTLINLQSLSLGFNQISNVTPLGGLTNLRGLSLYNNPISDISSFNRLTNLRTLRLYKTQISDISPLSKLTNLRELDLHDNQIGDISPLVDNPDIGEGDRVNLGGNPLNDKAYDSHIPALQGRGVRVSFDSKPEE